MRIGFTRELQRLQDEILSLGSEVEENLYKVVEALRQGDVVQARHLIDADTWVNEKRIHIGMECLALIATQQPTAGDMRLLAAIIEIAGELERIHDYIKGIAKITIMISEVRMLNSLIGLLPQMAEKARHMLRRALDAFAWRDADLARSIPAIDDEVDVLYKQIYQEIIKYIMNDPTALEHANYLEWAVHNLERSADRVTNICEWIVYMLTGEYVEMDFEVEAPPPLQARVAPSEFSV
jgi:phosphate transport system protein